MKRLLILCSFIGFSSFLQAQDTAPFRDTASYDFIFDYNFKRKIPPKNDFISYNDQHYRSDLLPYVKVKLKLLYVTEDDHRVKITTNSGDQVYSKRIKEPMEIVLDMGFAEDIKERLVPHFYHVHFLDSKKKIRSRITIEVRRNGRFYLNNEPYGQL